MPAAPTGRLERTRARIQAAALELFSRSGYEGTTVAEIATAAGVTEMTFYRHFGSKAQVLIDDPYDPLIAEAIGRQPLDLPPLLRTVRGIRETWRALPITDEEPIRQRIALVVEAPTLNPVIRASSAATEIAITDRLTQDGADPDEAAIAAASAMAALITALTRWAGRTDGSTLTDAVNLALDVLETCHAG